ncbi:PIR protein [Plasmodium malariae]|uniref:PIR protein n=1 Tax=Plasmodium malariae TaxID=5858 RepID=A0A1D3JIW7_PLAMA|nr:PIR protein [Plasmodium malariae]SBT86383.1 PIR protein [Plasmodium malariae]
MTPGTTEEKENTVTLFLQYKKEFEQTLSDTQNSKGSGGNPGRYCSPENFNFITDTDQTFISPCQDIGRYLIEIKQYYNSYDPKRCKYLNYRINSDEKYTKKPTWLEQYIVLSSKINNICKDEIKTINSDILKNLKQLYSYYDAFHKYDGTNGISNGGYCNKIQECYNFYTEHYDKCQKNSNDAFCEELINFKKAYDNKMSTVNPCPRLPYILPPTNTDYIFVASITTAITLLGTMTLFLLYKFTPLKSWLHSLSQRKKMIEVNEDQEETRGSLYNVHEDINRNYEGSFHNIGYHSQGYP